jgi:HEPN domain-containing protein
MAFLFNFTTMMSKEEHIVFWQESAFEDWDTAVFNVQGKRNTAALFFFHLSIEKLLKALWVKANAGNTPPFTHDLVSLASSADLDLSAEWYDYLSAISRWNIEGRYPDYKKKLHAIATEAYMNHHLEKLKELKAWLHSKI